MIVFCIAPSVLSAQVVSSSSGLKVTLLNQEPGPVEPGQVVEVRFKIENIGKETQHNVLFEVMPYYPLSLYSNESIKNLGFLQ